MDFKSQHATSPGTEKVSLQIHHFSAAADTSAQRMNISRPTTRYPHSHPSRSKKLRFDVKVLTICPPQRHSSSTGELDPFQLLK